jgi:lysophospholipase L1-like esterase
LPALLQQKLGVTIQDASFGGTSASYLDKDASLAHTLDNYCLAALARAITTGDYRVQRNARVNSLVITYFADRMAELEEVDLSGVKILLIDHCINDYQGGAVISDEQNPYNEYTYTGALRYALKNLQKEYPDLRIIMVSPTPVWYIETGKTGSDMDHGGGVLDQYVDAQRAVAEEFGVEWIDLYHGLYPEGSWDVGQQVSNDGIHPNEVGRELIAERLAEYLQ